MTPVFVDNIKIDLNTYDSIKWANRRVERHKHCVTCSMEQPNTNWHAHNRLIFYEESAQTSLITNVFCCLFNLQISKLTG